MQAKWWGVCYMRAAMRVLFITSNRLGDAVLSTGLLDHMLRVYPEARFTIACGPVAAGVFARMPRLERTLLLEKRRFDLHWAGLWRQVMGTWWDLVVDLRGSALGFLVLARRRVIVRGGRRAGHKTAQLGAALGVVPPPLPVCWVGMGDVVRAASLLPGGGPWIGLGPTANWSGKIWAPARFVALFQELAAGMPGAVDLGGVLSLPEASACLARCAVFVGNDSGLMHLAAATGTPTLGLFGPSPAREYAPAGQRTAFVVAPGPEGAAAMADLTVEAALEAALRLLG